jgi:hypothetical protein
MDDPSGSRDRGLDRTDTPIPAPDRLRDAIRSERRRLPGERPDTLMRRGMLSPARAVLAAPVVLGFSVVVGGSGSRGNTGTTFLLRRQTARLVAPASPSSAPLPRSRQSLECRWPGRRRPSSRAGHTGSPPRPVGSRPTTNDARISPADAGYRIMGDKSVWFDGVAVYGPGGGPAGQDDHSGPGRGTTSAARGLARHVATTDRDPAGTTTLPAGPPTSSIPALSPAGDCATCHARTCSAAPTAGRATGSGSKGRKVRASPPRGARRDDDHGHGRDVDGQGFDEEVSAAQPILDSMMFAP